MIGSLALGIQKLLPLTQKIYEGFIRTRAAKASLITVINLMEKTISNEDFFISKTSLLENNSIMFNNVSFNYQNTNKKIINSVDFKINQGEKVAIIGTTGSGKSTLVDLLIGLLPPSNGQVLINGKDITEL